MAANLNRVLLIGRLTRDPEVRYTSGGQAVTDLGLAVNRRYRDRDDQWQEEATFVDITVWGRTAENCGEYLSKGRSVFVEGRLQLDQWEDRNTGQKRSKLKVVATTVQFLDGRGGDRGGRAEGGGRGADRAEGGGRGADRAEGGRRGDDRGETVRGSSHGREPEESLEMDDDEVPF